MKRQRFKLGPFLGQISAVDPRYIPASAADRTSNLLLEDGALRVRYGYRTLANAQANFSAPYGLYYVQGYTSANAFVDEYLSFERLSTYVAGKCRLFARDCSSGAASEVKNGAASVDLAFAGQWRAFAFQDTSYLTNPSDTVGMYKHTLGDATSLVAFGPPANPVTQLTYSIDLGGLNTAYPQLSWAGIAVATGSHMAYTGNAGSANSLVDSQGRLVIAHTGTPVRSSVKISLDKTTAGSGNYFDWHDNDLYALTLSSGAASDGTLTGAGIRIDKNSVNVSFITSTGVTLAPTTMDIDYADAGDFGFTLTLRLNFADKTRNDWGAGNTTVSQITTGIAAGTMRYLLIEYTVLSGYSSVAYNLMSISKLTIGGVLILDPYYEGVKTFGYSYYVSSNGQESGIAGVLNISRLQLMGPKPSPALDGLGSWLTLTTTNGASSDQNRLYAFLNNHVDHAEYWYLYATQSDGTLAFKVRTSYLEQLRLDKYRTVSQFQVTNLKFGVPFQGWVTWFYSGGYQNVRHSRVGLPEKQAQDLDLADDFNRGSTFSLAEDFGDEAENAFSADNVLIICGKKGLYAQQGSAPWNLTPPKRLPSGQGVAGPFACARWHNDGGVPGVAFVSRNGDGVYFASVVDASDERGSRVVQIDEGIRGRIATFLRDGQGLTDFSTCRVWVDEALDALWVAMGSRALVLRRSSVIEGARHWEEYTFTMTGTIAYVAASLYRRQRWLLSGGKFQENEYNSSTLAYITGASRDAGSPITSIYWTSKVVQLPNCRIDAVEVLRDTLSDTVDVQFASSRQTATKTVANGYRFTRFNALQQGWEHQVTLTLSETTAPVRGCIVDYITLGRRPTS